MNLHFFDVLTAGKSPAEGQVLRFHAINYSDDETVSQRMLSVRIRDDVYVPAKDIDATPLALMELGQGISECEFSRAVAPVFESPDTLHIGIGTTSKLEPFVRHALYRNLIPARLSSSSGGRHLDLDTLFRAIAILRPQEMPEPFTADLSLLSRQFRSSMWDANWDLDNRAIRVKELLGAAQERSPKLIEHCIARSSSSAIKDALGLDAGEVSDLSSVVPSIVIHPSIITQSGYGLLYPLAIDVTYPDIAYMADLECDLSALVDDSDAGLESLLRKARGDGLPIVRVPLSRIPFVAPLGAIRPDDARRLKINLGFVKDNIARLRAATGLAARLRDEPILELSPQLADVDHRMWAGDFSRHDMEVMRALHEEGFDRWIDIAAGAHDLRVMDLAVRVLAREAPNLLPEGQREGWRAHVAARLNSTTPGSLAQELQAFQNASSEYPSAPGISFLLRRISGIAVRE